MAIVVGPEPAVPARLRQHGRGLPAEILDRLFGVTAEVAAYRALVTEKRPVHDDGAAGCRQRRQSQLTDQLPQRIVADRVVGVALRHARLVPYRGAVESPGLNLAAEPAAGFEQRQSARAAEDPFQ